MRHRDNWRWRDVTHAAVAMNPHSLIPWASLRYALGSAGVLLIASAIGGTSAGAIAAGSAINAGSVGLTSGVQRPRRAMLIAVGVLALTAFLGAVTARHLPLRLVTLAVLAALAGLVADNGGAASTIGVQGLVGFVVFGRFPQSPPVALQSTGLIVASGLVQVVLGMVFRRHGRPSEPPGPEGIFGRPDKRAVWHAVRLAIALVAAETASVYWHEQRSYWLALSVVTVLKPDWVSTASRAIDRILGTLVGATLIGLLVDWLHPQGWLLALLLVPVTWAMFALTSGNYALYAVFLAGEVVLLLGSVSGAAGITAVDRAVYTVVGGAFAVIVHAAVRRHRPAAYAG